MQVVSESERFGQQHSCRDCVTHESLLLIRMWLSLARNDVTIVVQIGYVLDNIKYW